MVPGILSCSSTQNGQYSPPQLATGGNQRAVANDQKCEPILLMSSCALVPIAEQAGCCDAGWCTMKPT